MAISSVYPATGETLKTFEPHGEAEVERRLALADSAFRSYRRTSYEERASSCARWPTSSRRTSSTIAETMTLEMGKPVVQARNEVTKCVGVLRYYAEHGAAMLADEPVAARPRRRARTSSTSRSARCWP